MLRVRRHTERWQLYATIGQALSAKVYPQDRQDVAQDIVCVLADADKAANGELDRQDMNDAALRVVMRYWKEHDKEWQPDREPDKRRRVDIDRITGHDSTGNPVFVADTVADSFQPDADAKIDAGNALSALPDRLIDIAEKRVAGDKLNKADQKYWERHAKIEPECRISSRRIEDKYSERRKKPQQTHVKRKISGAEISRLLERLPYSLQGLTVVCDYCGGRFLFEDMLTQNQRNMAQFACLNCNQRLEIDCI